MSNSILQAALNKVPNKPRPAVPSTHDNAVRNKAFQGFIADFNDSDLNHLTAHAVAKINTIANTILQFLSNAMYVANGDISTPDEGYEILNLKIAEAIFNILKTADSGFYCFANHDRFVNQNMPLKSLINGDLNLSQKLILISEILQNANAKIDERIAKTNAKIDEIRNSQIAKMQNANAKEEA